MSVQTSGWVGDAFPLSIKVGGRRPPASPPHYTAGETDPVDREVDAECVVKLIEQADELIFLKHAAKYNSNAHGAPERERRCAENYDK